MTCSHRSAAVVVAVILLVAGAQAAADRVKGVSEKEGKKIVAIFAEHPKLLSVMRRVIAAIDKKNKKANGKRGLLESQDELCASFEGEVACDEMTATSTCHCQTYQNLGGTIKGPGSYCNDPWCNTWCKNNGCP